MATVKGFDPAVSSQQPLDNEGHPVAIGVWGDTNNGIGVFGSSGTPDPPLMTLLGGVVGLSGFSNGVRGTSDLGTGVLGESYAGKAKGGSPVGVNGVTDRGVGVRGDSQTGNGVFGLTLGAASGVSGVHFSADHGSGVYGVSVLGSGIEGFTFSEHSTTAAVRGEAQRPGLAGLFVGDVKVTGRITKGGGGFHIDHPLDPQNKTLTHSFVESPEMLNVYSGTVTTDADGAARVHLPDYFDALNSDVRYQLTTVGSFARVTISEEVEGNAFAIASEEPNVKVCWQVTGVRNDAWAHTHRLQVEEDKPEPERGTYLHPDAFESDSTGRRQPHDAVTAALPDQLHEAAVAALSDPSAFGDVVSDARNWLEQRAIGRRPTRKS